MATQPDFSDTALLNPRGGNPDVLTCIASLSNDQVFTPPFLASQMLDTLETAWAEDHEGGSIWADPSVRFLDPATKSGVFLREITSRLVAGLAREIPDLQERVNHVLANQVFGLAISELTSLIARRSLYCSKDPRGNHSICSTFKDEAGNVWFEPTAHTWSGPTGRGRCDYCGASQSELDNREGLESHAYAFIHADSVQQLLEESFGDEMQFDVIIGNPPYQLKDGGHGASAVPIYQKFVETAKALDPRYLSMIIPSRWFAGGRGLDSFRREMLQDERIRVLVDYSDGRDCFPNVSVAGGVCYFLWSRDAPGLCEVTSNTKQGSVTATRPLLEPGADVFVRDNTGLEILKKILSVEQRGSSEGLSLPEEQRFVNQVSPQKPFGLRTYFRGDSKKKKASDVRVLQSGGQSWARRSAISEGAELVDKWKVFTSKSSSEHAGQTDKAGSRRVLSLTGVLPPGTAVTETYVLLGTFDTEKEARNCLSYVLTRFFRFLIVLRSSAQDVSRSAYGFIPLQDFSKSWTDAELYAKYDLSVDEISFVEALIRPMEPADV